MYTYIMHVYSHAKDYRGYGGMHACEEERVNFFDNDNDPFPSPLTHQNANLP